jgi:hypothetical protein
MFLYRWFAGGEQLADRVFFPRVSLGGGTYYQNTTK